MNGRNDAAAVVRSLARMMQGTEEVWGVMARAMKAP